MKNRIRTLAVALFSLAVVSSLNAEVFTSTYETKQWVGDYKSLVDMLVGPGVALHPSGNKIPSTKDVQIGVFSNLVAKVIPSFTNGVILSTGKIDQGASLTNESPNFYWDDEDQVDLDAGDEDLNEYFHDEVLANPAGIVLYIQPTNTTINIPFVMASEEFFYRANDVDSPTLEEYKDYSDKFAFFLKELGDASSVTNAAGNVIDVINSSMATNETGEALWWNIAKLPPEAGGGDVEIASVNQHTNTDYFIYNVFTNVDGSLDFPADDINLPMEFNGAIVGPVAVAKGLDTNKIYKLKIIIADSGGSRYDNFVNSAVFLRARGITSGADLKIDVSGPANMAGAGSATFTDTISNIGPAPADGVKVTHYLPVGVDPSTVSITCDGVPGDPATWGLEDGKDFFEWTIGDRFMPGSNVVLSITCTLPDAGSYTNVAKVVTSTGDYNPDNNSNSCVTVVGSMPMLRVEAIDTNKVYGTELSLSDLQFIFSIDGTNGTETVTGIDVTFTNALGEAADPTAAGAPVGTYGIYLSGIRGFDLSSFGRIDYVRGTFEVTPRPVTITAKDRTKAYGEVLTFDGTEFTTEPAALPNGERVTSVNITSAKASDASTEVGVYADEIVPSYAVTGIDTNNYDIVFSNGTLTVTQAVLNVSVSGDSDTRVYTGSLQTFDGTVTATSSDVGFDAAKFSYAGAKSASGTDVGDYTTALDAASCAYNDANYTVNWTVVSPVRLTITRSGLKIIAADHTKAYGEVLTFDGTEFTTEPAVLPNGEHVTSVDITSAKASDASTAVGVYAGEIVPFHVVTGIDTNNYDIVFSNGTLTVTQAVLNVSVSGDSTNKVYNGSVQTHHGTVTATSSDAGFDATKFSYAGSTDASGTAVGEYTTALDAASCAYNDANYAVNWTVVRPVKLTITRSGLRIVAADQTKAYGEVLTFDGTEFTASGLKPGDVVTSVNITSAKASDASTAVGVYADEIVPSYAVTGIDTNNYDIVFSNGTLTVTQAVLNVSVSGDSDTRVYSGSLQTFDGTVTATSSDAGFDAAKFSYTGAKSASGTAVGEYTTALDAAACAYSDANYAVNWTVVSPVKLTITRSGLRIVAADRTKAYGEVLTFDGTEFTTEPAVLPNGEHVTSVDITSAKASDASTAVGVYAGEIVPFHVVTGIDTNNYDIVFSNGTLTVTQAVLNVSVSGDSDTRVYNGSLQTFDGTVTATSSDAGFDAAKFSYTGAKSASGTAVGEYTTALDAASCAYNDANYAVNWTVVRPVKLTITRSRLRIVAADQTKAYGEVLTFDGTEFTASGLKPGDVVTSVNITSAKASDASTAVGVYADEIVPSYAVTGIDTNNYDIVFSNGTLTVTQAVLNVSVSGDNTNKVYNGSVQTHHGTVKAESSDAGFDRSKFSYVGSTNASGTAVGEYTTALDAAACAYSDANYAVNWTVVSPVKLTITPAALNVTVNGNSDTRVYTGSQQMFDGTVTAISSDAGFDTTKFSYTGTKTASGTDVGGYTTALAAAACAYSDANYTVNWTVVSPVKLTITPVALTITAKDQTKAYGETLTFDGTEFTASGLQPGDVVTSVNITSGKAADASTAVGVYADEIVPFHAVTGINTNNYDITFSNGTLTVTQAVLNVTVNGNSDTRVYNGSLQTFVGAVTASTSDAGFDATKFSYTGAKTASGTDVGDYTTVLAAGACSYSDANYTVNWTVGSPVKLKITPTALNVTVNGDSDTRVYTGSQQMFDGTVTATSSDAGFDATKFSYTGTKTTSGTDVGDYTTVLAAAACSYSDANYTVNWTLGSPVKLTITPVALTITAKDQTKAYGETLTFDGTEFTASGLQPGDVVTSVNITSGKAADASTAVGIYADEIVPLHAVTGINTNNYDITFSNGTLTVTQAVLTISVNDAEWKVGKPRPDYSFADFSDQLKAGDTMADITGGAGLATDVDYSNVVWSVSVPTETGTGRYADEIWIDPVSIDGLRAANYALAINPGTLTISSGEAVLKTSVTASLNWDTGLLDLELTVTNVGDGEVDHGCDYWAELKPGDPGSGESVSVERTFYIVSPTGTLSNGCDYVDLTSEVKHALLSVGNGDTVFDPGETITVKGISVYHWKRWLPEKFMDLDAFFAAGDLFALVKERYVAKEVQPNVSPDTGNDVVGTTAAQETDVSAETSATDVAALGDFTASVAATYNGWLRDGSGRIAALLKVTTSAVKKPTALSKSVITVTPFDGSKKRTYRTSIRPGGNPTDGFGVTYGNLGLAGTLDSCTVMAGRDFTKAKNGTSEKEFVKAMPMGVWTISGDADGKLAFAVTVGKKGKAKVKGILSNGKKVTLSAQGVLLEARDFAIPVMNAKKGVGFVAWITPDGVATVTDIAASDSEPPSAKKRK